MAGAAAASLPEREPGYSGLSSLNEARSLDTFLWLAFFSFLPFFSLFPPPPLLPRLAQAEGFKRKPGLADTGGGGSGEMKDGLSPAFSSSSHTQPGAKTS